MKLLVLLLFLWIQSSGLIIRNNGEQIRLSEIKILQSQDDNTGSVLEYTYRGKTATIQISELKRMNLKESMGKKKGVTTWKALLVTNRNQKYEVEIDVVEVTGINSEGKEESYSSNVIDKISL